MYWYMCSKVFLTIRSQFKKIQHYVFFYQEPEPAPATKFLEPEPPQNRTAPKHCIVVAVQVAWW